MIDSMARRLRLASLALAAVASAIGLVVILAWALGWSWVDATNPRLLWALVIGGALGYATHAFALAQAVERAQEQRALADQGRELAPTATRRATS